MDSKPKNAIALLSSGLDSAIAMAWLYSEGVNISCALTFDYGQRAKTQEISHAKQICSYYKIPHEVVELPWFSGFESKGLLSHNEALPEPTLKGLDQKRTSLKSATQVWVPNRNGVFLEVAAGIAESRKMSSIIVGFNAEEASTFPDNSSNYLKAINKALSLSTANQVKVVSPTIDMNKVEIVALGNSLSFPFELLWSCYQNQERMCGNCESCMRLKRALIHNGKTVDGLFINPVLR
ncbi:7-cyano-7-deazaguanine synthase QueC [bacterium]|nr:7-cyano-7-deazaguanine synthase QueC [bacterium]